MHSLGVISKTQICLLLRHLVAVHRIQSALDFTQHMTVLILIMVNQQDVWVCLWSEVYNENSKGDKTVPCGAPVLVKIMSDILSPSITNWGRHRR